MTANRAARLPALGMAVLSIGAAVAMVTFGLLAATAPPVVPVNEIATAHLTDDDNGGALFAVDDLAPGSQVTRCLEVRYQGASVDADVRLAAADVTGALADDLRVTVWVGTGGNFADCAGFIGAQVFDGPLRDLAAGPAGSPGVATGWQPDGDGVRTYRITVTMSPTSQLQVASSSATLRWVLPTAASTPPPAPPSTPAPKPSTPAATTPAPTTAAPTTTAPTPTAPTPTAPAPATTPTGTPSTEVPATASPEPEPSSTAAPAPAGDDKGGDRPSKGGISGAVESVAAFAQNAIAVAGELLNASGEVAKRTADHGALPIASLTVAGLFLLIQHAIDRRDPKLAMAPLWRDNFLRIGREEPMGGDDLADEDTR